MEKQIYDLLTAVQNGEQSIGEAQEQLLLLFSVSRRYSLSYLDGQEFEQKTEVLAKDQDDALKQLENICPNATYIFISRL